jgi:hypothetical protein
MTKTRFAPIVLLLLIASLIAAIATPPAGAAATAAQQCAATKIKAAGKFAASVAAAHAQYATTGDATKRDGSFTKASDKLERAFQKAEDKAVAAGASCPTTDDAAGVDAKLSATTELVAGAASGSRFVDNGDGTITDNTTGLMWEKKTTAPGSGVNFADPHDVDNSYSWTANLDATIPDGTAFTDFLAKLNNCVDDGTNPPTGVTGGFAGHCDWRLPTVLELEAIRLAPFPCGTNPCIDPIFGPTHPSNHWTSTNFAANPLEAWAVAFFNGSAGDDYKDDPDPVRAVRGGF